MPPSYLFVKKDFRCIYFSWYNLQIHNWCHDQFQYLNFIISYLLRITYEWCETIITNQVFSYKVVYSATAKPRPSVKNLKLKLCLLPSIQRLFTAIDTNSIKIFWKCVANLKIL